MQTCCSVSRVCEYDLLPDRCAIPELEMLHQDLCVGSLFGAIFYEHENNNAVINEG